MAVTEGMDYERCIGIADELKRLGERLGDLATEGGAMTETLADSWGGDDCDRFVFDWHFSAKPALVDGGGYAERVLVPAAQLLPVPKGVDLTAAAGLPEVACTVWSNVFMTANLQPDETFLVHGGSSGIGTMAIQLAKAAEQISYGPPRKSAAGLVGNIAGKDQPMGPHLPTDPANLSKGLSSNLDFWVDHDAELQERFNAWLAAN